MSASASPCVTIARLKVAICVFEALALIAGYWYVWANWPLTEHSGLYWYCFGLGLAIVAALALDLLRFKLTRSGSDLSTGRYIRQWLDDIATGFCGFAVIAGIWMAADPTDPQRQTSGLWLMGTAVTVFAIQHVVDWVLRRRKTLAT